MNYHWLPGLVVMVAVLAIHRPTAAQGQDGAAKSYVIPQPQGTWQTPGPIQQPTGTWQTPGAIQIPKGIQAITSSTQACERRLTVLADALFDFDKSDLRKDAVETLILLEPEITAGGQHKVIVEGHTDAVGTDTYNMRLSEQRARAVRDWLVQRGEVPADTEIKGYGKTQPVAPNQTVNGRDNPEGRQKNRRVEIAIKTCNK